MRVAIFSDVHGNLTAFEAVLAHIKGQAPDMTVFAGDLCLLGARPKECLDRLRDENIPSVYGNTDRMIGNQPLLSNDIEAEKHARNQKIGDIAGWTQAQLSTMDLSFLHGLSFQNRVSPGVSPNDDLFIVHANPLDVDQPIYPSEELQKKHLGEIKQTDKDPTLRHMLEDLDTGVLAFGHVHIPNVRHWNNIVLANISSVSLPLDGDSRAKYGLLTWEDGHGWTIEHQYVPYNVKQEKELLRQRQPPNWQSLSDRLGE
jgi:predicted phosphodiesterase